MDARTEFFGFKPGHTIGPYVVISPDESPLGLDQPIMPLGVGGSSSVYLAKQKLFGDSDILRAIKFFVFSEDVTRIRNVVANSPSLEHFVPELKALSEVSHRNLIKITDAGIYNFCDEKILFIVYEFIEGTTLGNFQPSENEDPHYLEPIIDSVLDLCDGISYLHSLGYHHYDIAPKNIFCDTRHSFNLVLGDLGLAQKSESISDSVVVIGSRKWMPDIAASYLNQTIDKETYLKLQPQWDLHAFILTLLDFFGKFTSTGQKEWLRHIDRELRVASGRLGSGESLSAKDVRDRLRFAMPTTRQVFGVPELSPGMSDKQITLMPVFQLVATRRIRTLIDHPAVQRLAKVPQLTAAPQTFPSANHTRLEHSLGTMEVMRRYLISLSNEDYAVGYLSTKHIETGLVCALLSNIHQFVFMNIINEMPNHTVIDDLFRRQNIIEKIKNIRDSDHFNIFELSSRVFKELDIDMLERLLCSRPDTAGEQVIHSILNCSIDARVVDYIFRDSHHLGIGNDRGLSEDLFQFITLHNRKIALNVRGISAAEQIIAQRYWLFNRFYWNRPNRRHVAILRNAIIYVISDPSYTGDLFDDFSNLDQYGAYTLLCDMMKKVQNPAVQDLAQFILPDKKRNYSVLFEMNLQEDSLLTNTFEKLDRLTADQWIKMEENLSKQIDSHGLLTNKFVALVDLPRERIPRKYGDDIAIIFDRKNKTSPSLPASSPIVSGIKESYNNQLRRLRVFVHPDCRPAPGKKVEFENSVREICQKFFNRALW